MTDDVQVRQNYITLSFSIFKFQNKKHYWVAPLLDGNPHRIVHTHLAHFPSLSLYIPLDAYPNYKYLPLNAACSQTLLHLQKTKCIEENLLVTPLLLLSYGPIKP